MTTLILVLGLIQPAQGAESVTFATAAGGESCGASMAALNELTGMSQSIDVPLLLGGLNRRSLSMHLVACSSAGVRQALAAAMGCWWTRAPGASDSYLYTLNTQVPLGSLGAYWNTSALVGKTSCESVVDSVMSPWISHGANVSFQVKDGTWPALLDPAGEAHLVEILSCLERPLARCPDLLPDPDSPDLDRQLVQPVRGGTWDDLVHHLAQAAAVSVVLGPDMVGSDPAPDELPAGSVSAALRQLTSVGICANIRHGIICLSHHGVDEQEHPAERRRLALIPISQLLHQRGDGDVISLTVSHCIQSESWSLPGWGVFYVDDSRSLVVAADPPLIHRVLDALDVIDQQGFERGIAALKTLPGSQP